MPSVSVVTNGTRLVGRAEELVRSGLLAVGISIDPPGPNDVYRGKGTFATCEAVVAEINEAKKALGSATPQIEIYTTVYEGTFSLLTDWADRLSEWGIDTLRFQHQIWLRTAQRMSTPAFWSSNSGDSKPRPGPSASSFIRRYPYRK